MRDLVANSRMAVAHVVCSDIGYSGTAFFVRPDGVAITCSHVIYRTVPDPHGRLEIEYSKDITLETVFGAYHAEIVHDVHSTTPIFCDYAVVKIRAKQDVPTLQVGSYDQLEPGDPALLLGFPLGLPLSAFTGIVSAKRVVPSHINALVDLRVFSLDASINSGISGGPVLAPSSNAVVGIVSTRMAAPVLERISELRKMTGSGDVLTGILDILETQTRYSCVGIGTAVSMEYALEELATVP